MYLFQKLLKLQHPKLELVAQLHQKASVQLPLDFPNLKMVVQSKLLAFSPKNLGVLLKEPEALISIPR